MRISIISTTSFPTPAPGYGGEVVMWDLANGLHELKNEVILYAVRNPYIEYPFKLNQLRNTSPNADWNAEFESYTYYKNDLLSSDVILDMSHGKSVAQYLHTFNIKKEIACYLIGNYWYKPNNKFNMIVNSAKQLELGINGMTGFEGTIFEKDHGYTGTIPKTSKFAHLGTNIDFYSFQEEKDDYFLWMGRFHPWKGTDIAIKLAKETGINLIITGGLSDSPDHIYWGQQYLKMIDGCDNIKYIPLPQDETHHIVKKELLQHAKGFLNPIQFHESFGLVNIEALSCGTPVITNALGALPEIIQHGTNGFLCQDYEHMKSFINSIDIIKPKDCRKSVEEKFSREKMAERFEKILEGCANGKQW